MIRERMEGIMNNLLLEMQHGRILDNIAVTNISRVLADGFNESELRFQAKKSQKKY